MPMPFMFLTLHLLPDDIFFFRLACALFRATQESSNLEGEQGAGTL